MISKEQHELMTRAAQGDPTAYNTSTQSYSTLRMDEYKEAEKLLVAAGETETLNKLRALVKQVELQKKKVELHKTVAYILMYVITFGMLAVSSLAQSYAHILLASIQFILLTIYTPLSIIQTMEEHRL